MASLSIEEFHANKEKAMVELLKGREIATQLQTLLLKPVEDHHSISPEDLAFQIFRSFSLSLSHLTSDTELTQIPAVDHGGSSSSSAHTKRKRGTKDRRGCYKRREGSDSQVIISATIEDGWSWRKYGQKKILNSDYPRCYYRCSHKHEGCKAIRQVQRMKGASISYETTYFHRHTCAERERDPHFIVEPDPLQRNLISFQTPPDHHMIQSKQDQQPITLKLEEDTHSEDEAKSTLEDAWQDFIGLDLLGYNKPEWAPYHEDHYSSEISSLHGFDQLSDINTTFHYFDAEINY